MSKIGDLVALSDPENDYQSIEFKKVDLALVEWIEKRYQMDVRNGEILFIRGKLYWTSKGCSRISESKKTKGIKFEYIDPNKFSLPIISQNPQRYLIVKCILEKQDNGIIEGTRILDLFKEKRLKFPKKCSCGNESRYFSKTDDPEIKKCSKCNKEYKGDEYWLLKDYIAFAETKAFMRACKLAYSVSIEDDIPEDDRDNAIDISSIKNKNIIDWEKPESKNIDITNISKNLENDSKPVTKTELKPLNNIKVEVNDQPKKEPIQLNPIKPQIAKPIDIKKVETKIETKTNENKDLDKPKSMSEITPLKMINPITKTETNPGPINSKIKMPYEKTKKYAIGSLELPNYAFSCKELDYEFNVCINICKEYLEKKFPDKTKFESIWKALTDDFEKSIKGKEDINLRICFFEIFKEIFSAADQIKAFEPFEKEFTENINRCIYFAYKNDKMAKEKFRTKLGEELLIQPEFEPYFTDLLEINNIIRFNPDSEFLVKDYEVKTK